MFADNFNDNTNDGWYLDDASITDGEMSYIHPAAHAQYIGIDAGIADTDLSIYYDATVQDTLK